MNTTPIYLKESDAEILRRCVREHRAMPDADVEGLKRLAAEIDRATVLPDDEFPSDAVALNSLVEVEYPDDGETLRCRLVLPSPGMSGGVDNGELSVLTPLGQALLGYRAGETVQWPLSRGFLQVKIRGVEQAGKPEPVAR